MKLPFGLGIFAVVCTLLSPFALAAEPAPRPPINFAAGTNDAIALEIQKCNAGDGQSCQDLGVKYKDGTGAARNPEQARIYFDKSCKLGVLVGCNDLAFLLARGDGGPIDTNAATVLLQQTCDRGLELACFNHAVMVSAVNPARGVELYRTACDMGAAQACYNLGSIYGDAEIIEKDVVLSQFYYRKACDGGLMRGCSALQVMQENTRLANIDNAKPLAEVIATLERDCTNLRPVACNDLAMRLFQGDGMARNWPRAVTLFKRACEINATTACFNLATMYSQGQGVARDASAAAALFLRACDGGHKLGCQTLAELYLTGDGIGRSPVRAERLFETLCNEGKEISCVSLAEFHENHASGKGRAEARKWYQAALALSPNNAQARLGIIRTRPATPPR